MRKDLHLKERSKLYSRKGEQLLLVFQQQAESFLQSDNEVVYEDLVDLMEKMLNGMSLITFSFRLMGAEPGVSLDNLPTSFNYPSTLLASLSKKIASFVPDLDPSELLKASVETSFLSSQRRLLLIQKTAWLAQNFIWFFSMNSRMKILFADTHALYSCMMRNFMEYKNLYTFLSPDHENYEETFKSYKIVTLIYGRSADVFREKYEVITKDSLDFEKSLQFLSGVKNIAHIANDKDLVNASEKKIQVWRNKLLRDSHSSR